MKQILKAIAIYIITFEARAVLYKYKPEIVAVTGSVGKTSTKDAITAVLSCGFYVWSGKKSFNSEIGIPLTILGCENPWLNIIGWIRVFMEGLKLIFLKNHYPRLLVIEVGTDRPGDIKKITSWLKSDVVVVTAFPEVPVHIEFFRSRDALIEEKTHLVKTLKTDGLLVLNRDDKDVRALKQLFPHNILTFGMKDGADISLHNPQIEYDKKGNPIGMFGKVSYKENKLPLHIKEVVGIHVFYSILAALAAGIGKGINVVAGLESLADFPFPPGRMRVLRGVRGSIIIDDSYNSSPAAAHAALGALQDINLSPLAFSGGVSGRKIAVLGDMLELGKWSADEHKKIGARVSEICSILVTVGIRSQFITDAALAKRMKKEDIRHFENSIDAGEFLKEFIGHGDIVLVKGSQGMRMEKTVERMLSNPEDKKLLVRQEKEWTMR